MKTDRLLTAIGRRVRDARLAKQLSQRQAAKEIGISYVHLCNLEHGKVNVSVKMLQRIAAKTGKPISHFLWGLK